MAHAVTPLQRERRRIALGISNKWPIARQSRRPRGLVNPLANCYRNAALQNLLHLPRFLNWILKHNEEGANWPCRTVDPNRKLSSKEESDPVIKKMGSEAMGCVPCLLKALTIAYWGNIHKYDHESGQLKLVQALDPDHSAIYRLHRLTERWFCVEPEGTSDDWTEHHVGESETAKKEHFQKARKRNMTAMQDSDEYIGRIFEGIETSIDTTTSHGEQLIQEFHSLFTVTTNAKKTGSGCNRTQHLADRSAQVLTIKLPDTKTYDIMTGLPSQRIETTFNNNAEAPFECPTCGEGCDLTEEWSIDAAPEYLRVLLDRKYTDPQTFLSKKTLTKVTMPEMLDLTNHITGSRDSRSGTKRNLKKASNRTTKKTIKSNDNVGRLRYRLIHAVYHEGSSMDAGHYTAGITGAPPSFEEEGKAYLESAINGEGKGSNVPFSQYWVSDSVVEGWGGYGQANRLTQDPVIRVGNNELGKRERVEFNASYLYYERMGEDSEGVRESVAWRNWINPRKRKCVERYQG